MDNNDKTFKVYGADYADVVKEPSLPTTVQQEPSQERSRLIYLDPAGNVESVSDEGHFSAAGKEFVQKGFSNVGDMISGAPVVAYGVRNLPDTANIKGGELRLKMNNFLQEATEFPNPPNAYLDHLKDKHQLTPMQRYQADEEIRALREYKAQNPELPVITPQTQQGIRDAITQSQQTIESRPKAEDTSIYKFGQDVKEYGKELAPLSQEAREAYPKSVLAGGIVSDVVTYGAGGVIAGVPAVTAMGATQNATNQYQQAKEKGASEATALEAGLYGAVVGSSEAIPVADALGILKSAKVGNILSKYTAGRVAQGATRVGVEELIQEAGAELANNLIARNIVKYDPERQIFTGVGEAAGIGFTAGAFMGAVAELVGGRRSKSQNTNIPSQKPEVESQNEIEQSQTPEVESQPDSDEISLMDDAPEEIPQTTTQKEIDDVLDTDKPLETILEESAQEQTSSLTEIPIMDDSGMEQVGTAMYDDASGGVYLPDGTPVYEPEGAVAAVGSDTVSSPSPIEKPVDVEKIQKLTTAQVNRTKNVLEKKAQKEELTPSEQDQLFAVSREKDKRSNIEPTVDIKANIVKSDVAVLPKGEDVNVDYAIVELDDLIPSNTDDFRVNPAFPQTLQPRDRTRPAAQQQVIDAANNLDPRLLMESISATDGAPIVAPSGVVESGNGRTMSLRKAFKDNQAGAANYVNTLHQAGYDTAGFKKPVLVRIRRTPMDDAARKVFAMQANERTTSAFSTTERALSDANALNENILGMYEGGSITNSDNKRFVRAFFGQTGVGNELGALIDRSGQLSQEGIQRIKGALLARAYSDENIVANVVESSDSDLRTIGDALVELSPYWSQMRSEAESGAINPEVDITTNLVDALNLILRSRRERKPIGAFIKSDDLFSGAIDQSTERLLRMFYNNDAMSRVSAKDKILERLKYYVDEARKTSATVDLMGQQTGSDQILDLMTERATLEERAAQEAKEGNNYDIFKQNDRQPENTVRDGESSSQPEQEQTREATPEEPIRSVQEVSDEQSVVKESLTAPAIKTEPTLKYFDDLSDRISSGNVTVEEFKQAYKTLEENAKTIKGELSKLTIPLLKKRGGGWDSQSKKKDYVISAFNDMNMDFTLGDSVTFSFFDKGGRDRAIADIVEATTQEKLDNYAKQVKEATEKRKARIEEFNKRLENPETLHDYRVLIRRNGKDSLTEEQSIRYDELVAEDAQNRRNDSRKKNIGSHNVKGVEFTIQKTTHTQKGHDLFVITMDNRVEKEDFKTLSAAAKQLGGYYSRYNKGDAIAGFQFKTEEAAQKFIDLQKGDVVVEKEQKSPSGKLRDLGTRLEDKATEKLQADRKTNTHRRAAMAASMEEDARRDIALAQTIKNIADAMDAGNIKYLDGIKHKTDIELLDKMAKASQYRRIRALSDANWKKEQAKKIGEEDIKLAEMPAPRLDKKELSKMADYASETAGLKMIGSKWKRVLKEAKSDPIVIRNPAFFEGFEKFFSIIKDKKDAPYFNGFTEEIIKDHRHLSRMGIENNNTLRAALREYVTHKVLEQGSDPITDAERELIGKKFDGYFPTPSKTVNKMVDLADIKDGDKILEPSAGKGSIIDGIKEQHPNADVTAIEPVHALRNILNLKGHNVTDRDFLEHTGKYDKIIMNPPFEKGQDIEHVRHAYDQLNDGGKIVAIMSEGSFYRSDKKSTEFREWLDDKGYSEKLPDGTFLESDRSTGVSTRLVVIDKTFSTPFAMPEKVATSSEHQSQLFSIGNGVKIRYTQNVTNKQKIAFENMVRKEVKKVFGTDVKVAVVDDVITPWGAKALGVYSDWDKSIGKVIYSTLSPDVKGSLHTAYHEGIHYLYRSGALDAEWKMLEDMADKEWIAKYRVEERWKKYKDDKDLMREEAIAEAFGDYASNKAQYSPTINRIFNKIKKFFAAIKRRLRSEQGITEWEQVFEAVYEGQYKNPDTNARRGEDMPYFQMPDQKDLPKISSGKDKKPDPAPKKREPRKEQGDMRSMDFGLPEVELREIMLDDNKKFIDKVKAATSKDALTTYAVSLRRTYQDRYIGWKRIQEQIEASRQAAGGGKLDFSENVYLSEESFTGKVGHKLEKLSREYVDRIVDRLSYLEQNGVSVEKVEKYLYALHAPERNAMIAKINEKFPDGGSGMTNAKAAEIVEEMKKNKLFKQVEEVQKLVRKMLDTSLDERVSQGLMTEKAAKQLKDTYQNYVPLRGTDEELKDFSMNIGQGFDTRKEESKRAFGRKSEAKDILSTAITVAEEAIIRGEKNAVFKSVYNLIEKNPNKALWEVNKVTLTPRLNANGMVEYVEVPDSIVRDDNVLIGKVDGNLVRLTIHDKRLLEPLRNMDVDRMNFWFRIMQPLTRWLSMTNTTLSPEFLVTNAFRDLQTGVMNIQELELKGIGKDITKGYLKALRASEQGLRGVYKGVEGKYFEEYSKYGGRVSFWRPDDVASQRRKLKKELHNRKPTPFNMTKRGAKATLAFVEHVNLSVENTIRVSAFIELRKRGVSPELAASAAKNLTVNFNRKGSASSAINAWYLFANASIQGTVRGLQAVVKSRRGKQIATGLAMLGASMDLMNYFMSPEDDDGQKIYDKIPTYVKATNIIIIDPTGKLKEVTKDMFGYDTVEDVGYVKIPMAYFWQVFYNMGQNASQYSRGGQTGSQMFVNIGTSAANNFNPLGHGDIMNVIAPTFIDPFLEIESNKNFADRPIAPQRNPYEIAPQPDSQTYFPSVGSGEKFVAQKLNELTGGNEVRSGAIDVSPESIEHMVEWMAGGSGRFIKKVIDATDKAVKGEDISVNKIPFASKVLGTTGYWIDRENAYKRMQNIAIAEKEIELARNKNQADPEDASVLIKLAPAAQSTRKILAKIRKARQSIEVSERTDEEKKAQEKRLRQEEERIIDTFNREYLKAIEEAGLTSKK